MNVRLKRWLCFFLAGLILCGGLFAGFNALVDPFGLFGDTILNWWSYDMTQNPRVAKAAWLDDHYEDYDSYIIGCSKTSSYPVEDLNEYYDADFYNMFMYGEDFYDVEKTVEYILDNYGAENIIVNSGLHDMTVYNDEGDSIKGNLHAEIDGSSMLAFYSKYLFLNPEYAIDKLEAYSDSGFLVNEDRVYIPETGAYDKSLRDVERISSVGEYLDLYPGFLEDRGHLETLDATDECLASIQRIKDMCDEAGAAFTYMISPMYDSELDTYVNDDLMDYFRQLAEITDFWDFSGYDSISADPRFFYDYAHFRNAAGTMALARMFDDDSVYIPDDFGVHVTKDTVEERILEYTQRDADTETQQSEVLVLMYHEIGDDLDSDNVTAETFRSQLIALKDAGYESVTYEDIINYTVSGADLPEKPVVITFDDGYLGNIEYAAPILEECGMTAVVSVIGVSVGKDTYKDTGIAITPHFTFEQAQQYVDSGVISIQSHSYDMHQVEYDGEGFRLGVYQNDSESEEEYVQTFIEDFTKSKDAIEQAYGQHVIGYAYPYGYYNDISEVLLSQMGVQVTVTSNVGYNTVVKGLPQTLRSMNRISVSEEQAGDALIEYLKGFE